MWKSKTPGIPDEEFERTESVPITKEEIRAIQISKGRLSVGQTVLDIGCGSGAKFENISNNFTPFGIDISEESANKADLSFKKRGGRAICSPATKVLEEFGENKFSGAILRSYLEHEHEPFEVLKNLKFTLKNDACVIIKVPNYDSVNRKIRKEKWCGFHFPDHVNQFTPKTLLKMVKDTNYEVLKFNFLDYLPTSDNMWMVVRPI